MSGEVSGAAHGFVPLRVTARLSHSGVLRDHPVLDGLLLAGEAARLDPASMDEADALPLPLARVETAHGWWWAASQATLRGVEAGAYGNRRPPIRLAEMLIADRTMSTVTGPDKMLRQPLSYRPEMLEMTFTCIGSAPEIARALSYVGGVGHRRAHGWGWISGWTVEADPEGPTLSDYATDLRLRHLPAPVARLVPGARAMTKDIPLTPPYWQRPRAVRCLALAPQRAA